MPVALMTVPFVQPGEDQALVAMAGQRFQRIGQLKVGAGLAREPVPFPDAVGEVEAGHADGRLNVGGGPGRRGCISRGHGRHLAHRIEQGQSQQGTSTLEERAARHSPGAVQHGGSSVKR
jgi:hypothetical protein